MRRPKPQRPPSQEVRVIVRARARARARARVKARARARARARRLTLTLTLTPNEVRATHLGVRSGDPTAVVGRAVRMSRPVTGAIA